MASGDRSLLIQSHSPANDITWKCSPIENPNLWNGINGVCCVWSFVLLLEFVFFEGPIEEHEYGVELYLVFNFGTTLIWVVESWLTFRYHQTHPPETSQGQFWDRLTHGILLIVALYFLSDSIQMFRQWRKVEEEFETSTLDVFISFVFYLAALIYVWKFGEPRSVAGTSSSHTNQAEGDYSAIP